MTMSDPTFLDALLVRCGIETEFQDVRGEVHQASADTKTLLLSAMGIKVDDENEASLALQRFDRQEWSRALPPVRVAYSSAGPVCVDVKLPAGTERVSWNIAFEEGDGLQGETAFSSLAFKDEKLLDATSIECRNLVLGATIPFGYHTLKLLPDGPECALIVTPGRCWLPSAFGENRRLWGVSAQLYLVRSATNWGIGDFSDLRRLMEICSTAGADVVGVNPLHAMFLDNPEIASPYSPASRHLLNVLNIDVLSVDEIIDCDAAHALMNSASFKQRLAACRLANLVDYAGVAGLKLPVLRILFDQCSQDTSSERWRCFEEFRSDRGHVMEQSCLFQAIRSHFSDQGRDDADWQNWPKDYQDPTSSHVSEFAYEHRDLIAFYIWLQWIADAQLAKAVTAAKSMEVGLYRDLAVGAHHSGAETWINQTVVVTNAQVGAPPDIGNPAGQDWGLPPFHPHALREEAYGSFIALVRANMRHAGGLRIDHVMALERLYWVPKGRAPVEGAYVSYNIEDLVGILTLESHRNRCLVVGEDLGTVPKGFRERMAEAGILSYQVLFFQKEAEGFVAPDCYPTLALAVVGSHDLPTLHGWWEGRDIDLKEKLNLYPKPQGAEEERLQRKQDRLQLTQAFQRENILPENDMIDVQRLVELSHSYLAKTRCLLVVAQIDDIATEENQVNVPCTTDQYPNWRRRLSLNVEELEELIKTKSITRL